MAHRLHGHGPEIPGRQAEAEHGRPLKHGIDDQRLSARQGYAQMNGRDGDVEQQGRVREPPHAQPAHQAGVEQRGAGHAAAADGEHHRKRGRRVQRVGEHLLGRVDEPQHASEQEGLAEDVADGDAVLRRLPVTAQDPAGQHRVVGVRVQGLGQAQQRPDEHGAAERRQGEEDVGP